MKKVFIGIGLGCCLLLVVAVVVKRERERRWKWEAIAMPEPLARVPKEWTPATLAERLQKSGKVRDAATFLEAAAQVGLRQVKAGGYRLPKKAGPLQLAEIFKAPPELRKVTIPEGWTARQIAARLKANDFVAADEFLLHAYPAGRLTSPWEGRLFPDTYFLPYKEPAPKLAARLIDRFDEIVAKLPRPFPVGANGKRLTLAEVVVLASLVERETSVDAERPLIAGVLLNRLRDGMRLQCDATVQYARQLALQSTAAHKNRLLYRDLAIQSPFNTYRVKGLPPGAICNPGEPALRAAAAPRASKYIFYVMSPKQGKHRFAVTYAEHQHNVRLYQQEAGFAR